MPKILTKEEKEDPAVLVTLSMRRSLLQKVDKFVEREVNYSSRSHAMRVALNELLKRGGAGNDRD